MHKTPWPCLIASSLLAGCQSTIGRAPGPEAPDLAAGASGTLIVPPLGGGALARKVRLIDLPTLRQVEFQLEEDPIAIGGLDEKGQFFYAFDADAELTWGDYGRMVIDAEPERSPHFERWRLRKVDVATRVESDFGGLEGFPRVLALAPRGDRLIAVHEPARAAEHPDERPSDVWSLDLTSGERRVVFHQLGRVQRCDWKPDGSAFALTGSAGGELFDATSLSSSGLQAHAFGPFTPDGRAYLRAEGEGHALVELDDEAVLVGDALLPWPATRGPAHERGDAKPIGLCGERLALYEALPTEGNHVESSIGRGGFVRLEHAAVKVANLETGTYATVLDGNDSSWTPLYTAMRIEPKAPAEGVASKESVGAAPH